MSKKKHKDALAWLKAQGDKAFKNQNKKVIDVITFLIKELKKPNYEKEILNARKYIQTHNTMSISTFCKLFTNPNAKPKTINQKADKRT